MLADDVTVPSTTSRRASGAVPPTVTPSVATTVLASGATPSAPTAGLAGIGTVRRERDLVQGSGRVDRWVRRDERGRVELLSDANASSQGLTGVVEIVTPFTTPIRVSFADFLSGRAHQIVRRRFGNNVLEDVRREVRHRI